MVKMVATGQSPNGKAILITDTDVSLDHLEFCGATVRDGNGARIRYQGGKLTLTRVAGPAGPAEEPEALRLA